MKSQETFNLQFLTIDQAQERSVARLLRQQAALAAFGSYAFRQPVLSNVLTEAARACAEAMGVPLCKICRHREAEDDLLIMAGHGWKPSIVGRVVSRADETSPQGRAYTTGQPVLIPDLREADDYALPSFYAEHGVVSTMAVIIKGKEGAPYGVLEIGSRVQHTYDGHDVDFLTGFANVLAEAVQTAQRADALRETIRQLEVVAAERAVLAEELKHRVRNNLQLVHAMLSSHLKLVTEGEVRASAEGIVRRVVTLAEVYEQLLGTGLGREIDLGGYLRSLCSSLPRLQRDTTDRIAVTCAAEAIPVGLDTVTALGMVVAELVANGFEHAFPDGKSGTITVCLRRSGVPADQAVLTVSDDGIGFVEKPGSKRHGVGLVRRLAQQVRGTTELRSERGAVWTFRFPVLPPTETTSPK
jgi:two-component sensor histidine kinase